MKKIFSVSFLLFFCTTCAYAQQPNSDSLIMLLSKAKEDTTRVDLLYQLSWNYPLSDPDSAYLFAQKGLKLAQAIGYTKGGMHCKEGLAAFWWAVGDYATAAKLLLQVLSFAHSQNDTSYQAGILSLLSVMHRDQGDYNEALLYAKKENSLQIKKIVCKSGLLIMK